MRVRHAMTTNIITVVPDDRAWTAAELVTRVGITGLPVVDANDAVLGMVTDLDFIRTYRKGGNLDTLTVGEVMRHRPPLVSPDAELYEAAALMEEWRVRLLPVVEDGRLAGIISRGDVLRGLAHRDGRPVATGLSVGTSNGSSKPSVNASTVPLWELGGES
ncbi:MAG: HPP family protein [Dehalococcoidia bacterium]